MPNNRGESGTAPGGRAARVRAQLAGATTTVGTKGLVALLLVNLAVATAVVSARSGGGAGGVVVSSAETTSDGNGVGEPAEPPTSTTALAVPPTTPPTVTAPTTPRAPRVTAPPLPTVPEVSVPAVLPEPAAPDLRQNAVWVVRPDGSGLRKVTDRGNVSEVVWSPDGRSVAVAHDGDLVVVDVDSGARHVVVDGTPGAAGAANMAQGWARDGSWISYMADGVGPVVQLVSPDGALRHSVPPDLQGPSLWSPDGRLLVFWGPSVRVYEPATGATRTVFDSPVSPLYCWSPDSSQLVFLYEGIEAIHVDGTSKRTIVSTPAGGSLPNTLTWSSANVLGYATFGPGEESLWTMLPDGTGHTKRVDQARSAPAWAPDGVRFAYLGTNGARDDGSWDVDLYVALDMGASRIKVVDDAPGMTITSPSWSPDGRHVGFSTQVFDQGPGA